MASYDAWKMNFRYPFKKSKAPSRRVEKKWWSRLMRETRRRNLDKISRTRPKTYGEYFDLMDLKETTKGYRRMK